MQDISSRGGSQFAFTSAELYMNTVIDGQKLSSQFLVLSVQSTLGVILLLSQSKCMQTSAELEYLN